MFKLIYRWRWTKSSFKVKFILTGEISVSTSYDQLADLKQQATKSVWQTSLLFWEIFIFSKSNFTFSWCTNTKLSKDRHESTKVNYVGIFDLNLVAFKKSSLVFNTPYRLLTKRIICFSSIFLNKTSYIFKKTQKKRWRRNFS